MFDVIVPTKIILFQKRITSVGYQATTYTIIGLRKKYCSSNFSLNTRHTESIRFLSSQQQRQSFIKN